jgi:predicted glycoside hydrolase/deacetylase ChbG (UPF0249 family)
MDTGADLARRRFLQLSLLRSLKPGISEMSCHPGYLRARPDVVYNLERDEELRTLTDARLKTMIAEAGIRLINYRDYARLVGTE